MRASTTFCWNSTPRAPATSRRCAWCPQEQGVVLGVVSSKLPPQLESVEFLRPRRIDEAARHLDVSQLAISPQCGFPSTVAGNSVTETDEAAQTGALCVEVARLVWGD